MARLGLAGPETVAAVDDRLYSCPNCSMTFGRETVLHGHMRSHRFDHHSSDSEEDAPTPKRRKKKSKLRTVKPLEVTWGSYACRIWTPKGPPAEVTVSGSEPHNIAAAMHDNTEVIEDDGSSDDISVIVIDDDDDANPVITVAGSHGAPIPAPDVVTTLAMETPAPTPHAAAAFVNPEGAPAAASTAAVTIPPFPASAAAAPITRDPLATAVSVATQTAIDLVKRNNVSDQAGAHYRYGGSGKAIDGNDNGCGKSLAVYDNVLYGKGVSGYGGVAGCSSGNDTYSISTVARRESNKVCGKVYSCRNCKSTFSTPQALGGHVRSHHRIMDTTDMASCFSTTHPGVATTELSQATGMNNYVAATDAPVNTMGRRLPFFLAGCSNTQALPVSRPVHHPTEGLSIHGNTLTGHFPAAISATGWSLPATTNNILPSIPIENQKDGCCSFNPGLFSRRQENSLLKERAMVPSNAITTSTSTPHPSVAAATECSQVITEVDNNVAAIDALANTMRHLPFFISSRSATHVPPVSMPVHQITEGMVAMAVNPVTSHFPAAMVAYGWSFAATTNSVLPTIPLQTQEENPPQGRLVHANELADPSQNQVENPPEEIVPGSNRGRTILLFGKNIAEVPKK